MRTSPLRKIKSGMKIGKAVESGRMIVESRPRYTLKQLLAQCEPGARRSKEDREWLTAKPVGRELI